MSCFCNDAILELATSLYVISCIQQIPLVGVIYRQRLRECGNRGDFGNLVRSVVSRRGRHRLCDLRFIHQFGANCDDVVIIAHHEQIHAMHRALFGRIIQVKAFHQQTRIARSTASLLHVHAAIQHRIHLVVRKTVFRRAVGGNGAHGFARDLDGVKGKATVVVGVEEIKRDVFEEITDGSVTRMEMAMCLL